MTDVPFSFTPVQQESIQFNNPVGESSQTAIAGICNALLAICLPVGSFIDSMLTEAQFQAQLLNPSPQTWILSDGRAVAGSAYTEITGFSNVPDQRGIYRRGKNNGRSDGNQNPDGDLPLGTYTADKFASHTHGYIRNTNEQFVDSGGDFQAMRSPGSFVSDATGGNETATKNNTVNTFIRIN